MTAGAGTRISARGHVPGLPNGSPAPAAPPDPAGLRLGITMPEAGRHGSGRQAPRSSTRAPTPRCKRAVACHMPIRKLASPPGPGQKVDGLADDRLFQRARQGGAGRSRVSARRCLSSSTHSRIRSSSASTWTSPVTTGAIAASQVTAAAASPSSQAPPSCRSRKRPPARRPTGPDPRDPLVLQRGAAVEHHQVGQRDVRPRFDRLPGPLGQQPGRDQPPHASAVFLRHA